MKESRFRQTTTSTSQKRPFAGEQNVLRFNKIGKLARPTDKLLRVSIDELTEKSTQILLTFLFHRAGLQLGEQK